MEGGTGCTAIFCPEGAVAGVDVRGGGPATRETDLLDPVNMIEKVHCIMLSGGSAYGLAAAEGAMAYLEEPEALFPGDMGLELLICVPFAQREGEERADSSMADELMLYLVHGCLHAAGENDLQESDRMSMRRRESEVLAELRKKYKFSEIFPA